MEIDPELNFEDQYEKASDIADQCGYLATKSRNGMARVITVHDNDQQRHFRCVYELPTTKDTKAKVKWAYHLTKIEEWKRHLVWP